MTSDSRVEIRPDDPRSAAATALLQEHLDDVARHSPPESIHAMTPDALAAPGLSFWTAWIDDELGGCAALLELDARHGEVKAMRTTRGHLRTGVASALLRYIIDEARRRGYRRLSLETGSMEAFAPARTLYARFGFEYCAPFGNYMLDPNSVFMTLEM